MCLNDIYDFQFNSNKEASQAVESNLPRYFISLNQFDLSGGYIPECFIWNSTKKMFVENLKPPKTNFNAVIGKLWQYLHRSDLVVVKKLYPGTVLYCYWDSKLHTLYNPNDYDILDYKFDTTHIKLRLNCEAFINNNMNEVVEPITYLTYNTGTGISYDNFHVIDTEYNKIYKSKELKPWTALYRQYNKAVNYFLYTKRYIPLSSFWEATRLYDYSQDDNSKYDLKLIYETSTFYKQ